jgi:hypothetical protein
MEERKSILGAVLHCCSKDMVDVCVILLVVAVQVGDGEKTDFVAPLKTVFLLA